VGSFMFFNELSIFMSPVVHLSLGWSEPCSILVFQRVGAVCPNFLVQNEKSKHLIRGAARPLQSNGSNLLTEPEVESPKRNQKSTIFCLKGTVVHFVEYLVDAASESTRFSSARHIPPTTVPDKWLCR
jgi:hypothetical protein